MSNFLSNTYLGNTLSSYLIFLGIIIASIIIGRLLFLISRKIIRVKAAKTATKIDDVLVEVLERPLVFLISIIGLMVGLKTLYISESVNNFFQNLISILLTIDVAWFVISFVDSLLVHYIQPITDKTKSDVDDMLLPLVRRLAKITLIIIAAIIIIDKFGYNITSLVAGLGIGGIALAFAAKDLLANLFGGFAIITDKPFKMGDRIKIENYDGWVREIGLRTTRVETLDGFQLIVPNSKIADSILENVSREQARKVKMVFGLEYNTSIKKMEEAKKILHEIIKKNKDTRDDSIIGFTEFGESSLNIQAIYWIKNLDKIIEAKHNVNMEIKKQFERAKINMAFPSRTVYMKKA